MLLKSNQMPWIMWIVWRIHQTFRTWTPLKQLLLLNHNQLQRQLQLQRHLQLQCIPINGLSATLVAVCSNGHHRFPHILRPWVAGHHRYPRTRQVISIPRIQHHDPIQARQALALPHGVHPQRVHPVDPAAQPPDDPLIRWPRQPQHVVQQAATVRKVCPCSVATGIPCRPTRSALWAASMPVHTSSLG